MEVIVVGSGVSGLVAAHATLQASEDVHVTLVEASERLGGHDTTVRLPSGEPVDLGYMVLNEHAYPNMMALYNELGVETVETDMSFSITVPGARSWSFQKGCTWAMRNVFRPRLWQFVRAHGDFRHKALHLILTESEESYSDFTKRLDQDFVLFWLSPFIKAVWSVGSDQDIQSFAALPLVRFLSNHGFLQPVWNGLLQWRTPAGRSEDEVQAIIEACQSTGRFTLRAGRPVVECAATADAVHITLDSGAHIKADKTILACGPDVQEKILHMSDPERSGLLKAVQTTHWDVVLHQDCSYMPPKQCEWASWNVVGDVLTYWLSNLQHLQDDRVFASLFPAGSGKENSVEGVLHVCRMAHPVLSVEACRARAELVRLQQGSRIVHAGAWTSTGFHEGGVASGLLAARAVVGSASVPVLYPMSCSPVAARPVLVQLVHAIVAREPCEKPGGGAPMSFASRHSCHRFDSRFPPAGARAADHLLGGSEPCSSSMILQDADVRRTFAAETGVWPDGPISVTCTLRPLSMVPAFNPLTAYFAWNSGSARPVAALFEVHNTPWEERCLYGMILNEALTVHECEKKMHVSPGHPSPMSMPQQRYRFSVEGEDKFDIELLDASGSCMFKVDWRAAASDESKTLHGSVYAFAEVYARMLYRLAQGSREYRSYEPQARRSQELLRAHAEYVLSSVVLCATGHVPAALSHFAVGGLSLYHHWWRRESNVVVAVLLTVVIFCWRVWQARAIAELMAPLAVLIAAAFSSVDTVGQATLSSTIRFQGLGPMAVLLLLARGEAWSGLGLGVLVHSAMAVLVENLQPQRAGSSTRRLDVSAQHQDVVIHLRLLLFTLGYMSFVRQEWHRAWDTSLSPHGMHIATLRCTAMFSGHLLADLWLALTTGVQGRKAMKLNLEIVIHHVVFLMTAFVNMAYTMFAPDFVWLICGELSSFFLALRSLVPSLRNLFSVLFALSFFVVRFPLYICGAWVCACRLAGFERPVAIPLPAVALTPAAVAAGLLLNAMWARLIFNKFRKQVIEVILRFIVDLVTGGSFGPRIALCLPGDVEPRRAAVLRVHDPERFLRALVFRGEVGLGEAYVEGLWDVRECLNGSCDPRDAHGLFHLLRTAARSYLRLSRLVSNASVAVPDMRSTNSRQESIMAHYDDPTELFEAFLGPTMVYTAALWDRDDPAGDTLDAAQIRKIDRILDLAGVHSKKPSRLLDLGCGWGTLVQTAAKGRCAHGTGITNSPSMVATCMRLRQDATREHFELRDFLDLPYVPEHEAFDAITCVEALEAVHHPDYRRFAASVHRALKADGRAVFQIIHSYSVRNPSIRNKEFRPGGTFVQTYIFPGQQLPYLEYVYEEFAASGLECVYAESTSQDYTRTLREWRQNLQAAEALRGTDAAGAPCWSKQIFRKYMFYFAWCEAGFAEGILDVTRVVFKKKSASFTEGGARLSEMYKPSRLNGGQV